MDHPLDDKSFATLSLFILPDKWEVVTPVTDDVEGYPAAYEAWTTVFQIQERKRNNLILLMPLFLTEPVFAVCYAHC